MVRTRMTVIASGVVAVLTCGSTLNAARAAVGQARANRDAHSQSAPADRSSVTVRVTPLIRLTQGDARGVVIVPRHADNRVLRVILESESYYSRSDIQLDGEYAALSYPVSWRDLPPGSYCITVQVYGPTGMRTSTTIGSIDALQKER